MTPHAFLNLLWQDKPEDLYVLLWTLQDKRSHWFRDIRQAGDFAANANGHDVYVGVGLSKADHGSSRRCPSDEIAGIGSLWTDLDLKSEAHAKPLPGSIPEALSILPPSMPPSIVISTGNGVHPWWLLKEPLIFDSEEERADTARLVARWHSLLRGKRRSASAGASGRCGRLPEPGARVHVNPQIRRAVPSRHPRRLRGGLQGVRLPGRRDARAKADFAR